MGRLWSAVMVVLVMAAPGFAATYHVNPNRGSDDGDGSAGRPWRTLEQVIADKHFESLKGGDTVLLYDGYHGTLHFQGDNDEMITIAAAEGQRPTASRLTIRQGSNWCVRGLTLSPSFGEPYNGYIVTYGEKGESSNIMVEDCFVFTELDASDWSAQDWLDANSGLFVGRHGRGLVARNNYILNTRFGIALASYDAVCEGNVISDFSADAIRATRDGQTIRHNIIKNIYLSAEDGDKNHDDAIQCFLFNKGTGTLRNITIVGNIVIAREDPDQKWPASLQAIGFFDGPLVEFVVTDNVIDTNHWHGISLYDAQGCRIERNVVWTSTEQKPIPWIMLGQKRKQAKNNTVRNNLAPRFKLNQPGTVESDNETVTEADFRRGLKRTYDMIIEAYGERHATADRPRLGT